MDAYCVKCHEKREMTAAEAVYTSAGAPATRGKCPVCGTTLFRMGATEAHKGLPRPPRTTPESKGKKQKLIPKLVIVESPAKARTVGKFLGKGYAVKASVGHVRDLLKSQLSVDVEHGFEPKYRVPNEKRSLVKELKSATGAAQNIYLATDPDREGEAIAWHLIEATEMELGRAKRVVFHEITQDAIEKAFSEPRQVDMNLVNAQQTRRILDRLVGYKISPLLWAKVRSRTSAGRVQSVAVRLIVEREREIEAFVPVEYWSIEADLLKIAPDLSEAEKRFRAKLVKINGRNAELKEQKDAEAIVSELAKALYLVSSVKKGERKRSPAPPFTTSSLQQEASRRLGFTARKTMAVAQDLYEGIEVDNQGAVGLITYMRTDSTNVSRQAQEEARRYIRQNFGAPALPAEAPIYRTRAKGAQEAHEAIRPTSVFRTPAEIKKYLSSDQYKLYEQIWKRFVASQMAAAVYDTMTVDVSAGKSADNLPYLFRASGFRVRFPGFLAVYEESLDEDAKPEEGEGIKLPALADGEEVKLGKLLPEQHFTQPPPRYTEATLVKTLEQYGIGRPSTYAPIISTIQQRGYVRRAEKRLHPTELGIVVNDLVVSHFNDIINVEFTANMEEELDQIASGERAWVPVLRDFYAPFEKALKDAEAHMPKVEVEDTPVGITCEKCGHEMVLKHGRFGKFIACSNFPACKNTKPWVEKIGVKCPKCGGELAERRTRKGRVFYGCSNYPDCDFTSWKRPVATPCPHCGGLLVQQNSQWLQCLECEEKVPADGRLESATST